MYRNCCVPQCKAQRQDAKFHRFPVQKEYRDQWIRNIGSEKLQKMENLVDKVFVCHKHFETRFTTASGRLRIGAVPTLFTKFQTYQKISDRNQHNDHMYCTRSKQATTVTLDWSNTLPTDNVTIVTTDNSISSILTINEIKFLSLQWANDSISCSVETDDEELEEPASTLVCRICLAFDVRMYHIGDHNLSQHFQHVTGILLKPDDRLPKMLCWECVGRLTSASRFRNKALRAHNLLSSKVNMKTYMSMRDVKSINRIYNRLQSTLTPHYLNGYDSALTGDVSALNGGDSALIGDDSALTGDDSALNGGDSALIGVDSALAGDDSVLTGDKSAVTVHMAETVKCESESGEEDCEYDDVTEIVLQVPHEELVAYEDLADEPHSVVKKRPRVKHKRVNPPVTTRGRLRNQSREVTQPVHSPSPALSPPPLMNKTGRYVKKTIGRSLASGLDETLFTVRVLSQAEQLGELRQRRESHAYVQARYKCAVCYKHFHTQASYDEHTVKHSDRNGPHECHICRIRLSSSRTLRKHVTACHSRSYDCRACAFSTKDRGVAKRHEMFHTGVKYKCPHCAKQFDKQTTCLSHVRIKHPSPFVCELCGFAFINQRGVDIHKMKKHTLSKNAPLAGPHCGECGVRFASQEAYTRHLKLSARHRRSDDPEPLSNDPQIEQKKEEKQLADDEPICCEQCGLRCADYRAYARHFLRAHPGRNRTLYPPRAACMCHHCGKIFQGRVQLKGHMWVHTGDKPFKCSECNKTFSNRPALQLHSRSHSGARPAFPCSVCGKSFGFYSNCRRHMLIHTGLKPYKCDTCDKCFMTVAERRSHVDHVHLKVPWPKRTRPPRAHT